MSSTIYLDYNSTTPIYPEVFEAMLPFLETEYGNPSSITNDLGIKAKNALEESRISLTNLLNCKKEEVIFTSGGTESNFIAIVGAYLARPGKNHFITSRVEHPALLETFNFLKSIAPVEVSYLKVDSSGELDLDELKKSIKENTNLISLMFANNETGVIFPIKEISQIAKSNGVLFHSDAVQAVGRCDINFSDIGLDLLSLSGHKFGAAKGIGALIIRNNTPWTTVNKGGGQEGGRRGGTEAVANIVGLGIAAKISKDKINSHKLKNIELIRDYFEEELIKGLPQCRVNCQNSKRLFHTSSIQIPGIIGAEFLGIMNKKNIIFSTGSACKSSSQEPSHVLKAIGLGLIECISTIRISFGHDTTKAEVDFVVQEILSVVTELRNKSNYEVERLLVNV